MDILKKELRQVKKDYLLYNMDSTLEANNELLYFMFETDSVMIVYKRFDIDTLYNEIVLNKNDFIKLDHKDFLKILNSMIFYSYAID